MIDTLCATILYCCRQILFCKALKSKENEAYILRDLKCCKTKSTFYCTSQNLLFSLKLRLRLDFIFSFRLLMSQIFYLLR